MTATVDIGTALPGNLHWLGVAVFGVFRVIVFDAFSCF